MQVQRMVDLTASNASSIVAICAKAYNSCPSKAVIFPDRWNQQHKCYTGYDFVNGYWHGFGNLQVRIFPLFAWIPHTGSLERSRLACWIHSGLLEKNWSQAMRKKNQLSCCLCLWKELCFIFKAPRLHLGTAFTPL